MGGGGCVGFRGGDNICIHDARGRVAVMPSSGSRPSPPFMRTPTIQRSCRNAPEIPPKGSTPTAATIAASASAFAPDGTLGVALSEAGGGGGKGGRGEDADGKGTGDVSPIPEGGDGGGGSGSGVGRSPIEAASSLGAAASSAAAAATAGAVALAEDEAAAGSLWGLSGWFSRRSSISPPFSPQPGTTTGKSVGVAIDGKNKEAFAGGGDRGNGAVRVEEIGAQGVLGIPEMARGGVSNAPAPLTADFTEEGRRHEDEGYATDTDEDGDLYGKTLRPTSEQLVGPSRDGETRGAVIPFHPSPPNATQASCLILRRRRLSCV